MSVSIMEWTAVSAWADELAWAIARRHDHRYIAILIHDAPRGLRLTGQQATPDAKGASENIERWVEFVQRGTVKGREVVSIVPSAEVKNVVKDTPPAAGASKVQMLRGNEYMRVWINKGGNHYLIYFPTGGSA